LHAEKAAIQKLEDGNVVCGFNQELGRLESEQRVEVLARPNRFVGVLFLYFLPRQVFGLVLEDVVVLVCIFFL
jgi:hypothetical protein